MLHFLIYDVLGTPAILVGLFSLIGLLLQKKGISDVISGTLKTIMGFVILTAGAGIIAYTLTIFSQLFEHSFHIQGVVPNTDAMAALAQKNYGTETATIMVLGMLINIALARLTPLKYIFLTGHHTLYMAAMLAVILSVGGLSGGWVVAIGAVILGAMMVISPAIVKPVGEEPHAVGFAARRVDGVKAQQLPGELKGRGHQRRSVSQSRQLIHSWR